MESLVVSRRRRGKPSGQERRRRGKPSGQEEEALYSARILPKLLIK